MTPTGERLQQEFAKGPKPWPLHPLAGPLCDCCLHIRRVGEDSPRRVPAAYIWTTPHGHEVPLCVSCCAHWRANAVEDPELLPVRVRSVEEVRA